MFRESNHGDKVYKCSEIRNCALITADSTGRQFCEFLPGDNKIFKTKFLENKLEIFLKIFRKGRKDNCPSFCQFIEKSIEDKFFFSKIWLGAIAPQGVPKSKKLLQSIDRGFRDLFNGVKILALRSAKLKINGVKLLLSKKY